MSRLRTWLCARPGAGVLMGCAATALLFSGLGTASYAANVWLALLPGALGIAWFARRPMPFAARKWAYGRGLAVILTGWWIPAYVGSLLFGLWGLSSGVVTMFVLGAAAYEGTILLTNGVALAIALGVARWAGEDSDMDDARPNPVR